MPVHEVYRNGVVVSRTEVPSTIDDVKAEAQKRIIALCGASTLEGAMIKQINAAMRAVKLSDAKQTRDLTSDEMADETTLHAMANGINAIRAASNIIEASPPIEVGTDPRWPA